MAEPILETTVRGDDIEVLEKMVHQILEAIYANNQMIDVAITIKATVRPPVNSMSLLSFIKKHPEGLTSGAIYENFEGFNCFDVLRELKASRFVHWTQDRWYPGASQEELNRDG